jgi:hypothetical protein
LVSTGSARRTGLDLFAQTQTMMLPFVVFAAPTIEPATDDQGLRIWNKSIRIFSSAIVSAREQSPGFCAVIQESTHLG